MSGFDWLVCPHCRQPLQVTERVARCAAGHAFDQARQGYLNLLGRGQAQHADTAEMVARREAFLSTGLYSPIADAVVDAVGARSRVVEVGAGTGWYLARTLDAREHAQGLGIDVSVAAARRLARAHPRMVAVVADAWQPLPLAGDCADAVLSIFAPRNPAEFARILAPGGVLVTVTPRAGHLSSARERFALLAVEPGKQERLDATLGAVLRRGETVEVDVAMDLDSQQAADLVGMGPNAFHDHGETGAISTRAEVSVTRWHQD